MSHKNGNYKHSRIDLSIFTQVSAGKIVASPIGDGARLTKSSGVILLSFSFPGLHENGSLWTWYFP